MRLFMGVTGCECIHYAPFFRHPTSPDNNYAHDADETDDANADFLYST